MPLIYRGTSNTIPVTQLSSTQYYNTHFEQMYYYLYLMFFSDIIGHYRIKLRILQLLQ